MSTVRLDARSGFGRWALTGLITGLLAGVVFIVFEIIIAAITGPSPIAPLRLISAIVLGGGTLPPPPVAAPAAAIIVGLIVHFVLAAIFGVIFAAILGALASRVGALAGRSALVGAATAGGFLLWIVNFYLIAPAAFPWFGMANPVVQFFAHTIFFGTTFGLLLAARIGGEQSARE